MKIKRLLALVMALALALSLAAMPALADDPATSGSFGGDLTWTYDSETGTLTISGTGAMASYFDGNIPWVAYNYDIESVVIGSGVTSIGDDAFAECESLTSVTIPASVTSIGGGVFDGCTNLTEVNYTGTEEQWAALMANNPDFELPDNVDLICNNSEPTPTPDCGGYLQTTNAVIRDSLSWNVYFHIDDYAEMTAPCIVVTCENDSSLNGEYALTYESGRDAYFITVPVRHRLIDEEITFALKDGDTEYTLKFGSAEGTEYDAVPYSFNSYLDVVNRNAAYSGIVTAIRAYRDALLAVWPVNA